MKKKLHINPIPPQELDIAFTPGEHELGRIFHFKMFKLLWIPFNAGMSCRIDGDERFHFSTDRDRFLPLFLANGLPWTPSKSGSIISAPKMYLVLGILLGRAFTQQHGVDDLVTDKYLRVLLQIVADFGIDEKLPEALQEMLHQNRLRIKGTTRLLVMESAAILMPEEQLFLIHYLVELWRYAEQAGEKNEKSYLTRIVEIGITLDWDNISPEYGGTLSYIFCASLICLGRRTSRKDRKIFDQVFKLVPNNSGLQFKLAISRNSREQTRMDWFYFMGTGAVPVIYSNTRPIEYKMPNPKQYRPTPPVQPPSMDIITESHREALFDLICSNSIKDLLNDHLSGKRGLLLPSARLKEIVQWLAREPCQQNLIILWVLREKALSGYKSARNYHGMYAGLAMAIGGYVGKYLGGDDAEAFLDSVLSAEQWQEAKSLFEQRNSTPRFSIPALVNFDTEVSKSHYDFLLLNGYMSVPFMSWGSYIRHPAKYFERGGQEGRHILCDKAEGALIGGAIGDAIGKPLKYTNPGTHEPVTWYGKYPEGEIGADACYTEATRLSLVLAEHIPQQMGVMSWKVVEQIERTTIRRKGKVLRDFLQSHLAVESAGNGAAIRCAPIGIAYRNNPYGVKLVAGMQARMTHDDPMAIASSILIASAVAMLITMEPEKLQTLEAKIYFCRTLARSIEGIEGEKEYVTRNGGVKSSIYERVHNDIPAFLKQHLSIQEVQEIFWSGAYSLESVPFALYCFLSFPNDFERVLFHAANFSRDSSSVASMACALAGALNGLKLSLQQLAVPKTGDAVMNHNGDYLAGLEEREAILKAAQGLTGLF